MPTRNIVLTDQQSAFVDALVASGRFQNASEALRAGLRMLEREESEWEAARRGVLEGLEDIRQGRTVDGEKAGRRILDEVFGRE
jgi:antitoxin ParD1/3/4